MIRGPAAQIGARTEKRHDSAVGEYLRQVREVPFQFAIVFRT
jgi:hypothetical protein